MKVKELLSRLPDLGEAKTEIFQDWNRNVVAMIEFNSVSGEMFNKIFIVETKHEEFKIYWVTEAVSVMQQKRMTSCEIVPLKEFHHFLSLGKKEFTIFDQKLYSIYLKEQTTEAI